MPDAVWWWSFIAIDGTIIALIVQGIRDVRRERRAVALLNDAVNRVATAARLMLEEQKATNAFVRQIKQQLAEIHALVKAEAERIRP